MKVSISSNSGANLFKSAYCDLGGAFGPKLAGLSSESLRLLVANDDLLPSLNRCSQHVCVLRNLQAEVEAFQLPR